MASPAPAKLMYRMSDVKPKSGWVDGSRRSHCVICTKKFFLAMGKHHCRRCGDVICKDCSTFALAELPGAGRVKIRTCRLCHAKDVDAGEYMAPPSSSSEDEDLEDELLQKSEMMLFSPRGNQTPHAPPTSTARLCPKLDQTTITEEEDDRYTVQSYASGDSSTDTLSPKRYHK